MNILRCIDTNEGEGSVIDFEYEVDEEKNFKCVDVRMYAVINSVVGEKIPINIVDKLVIAKEMLRYLEYEKMNEKKDNEDV
jgi:hypothetical protein